VSISANVSVIGSEGGDRRRLATQEVEMRYLLLIYGDETRGMSMGEDQQKALLDEWMQYTEEIRGAGAAVAGDALQPTSTATTVTRGDDGAALVTDGPFAETREQLGGYYLLDVKDLDEAIEWARKCPGSRTGKIELRPINEFDSA
jgi:hypothetical protein